MNPGTPDRLLVGPLLRYVDETAATVWAEVARPGDVTVRSGERTWTDHTFAVHGHHYVLVVVDGLAPGSTYPYEVELGGRTVWPQADSDLPASRIRTLDTTRSLSLLFGSCRVSEPHDARATEQFGVDVLRAYALRMARSDDSEWPDVFAMLGDQVYADETSDAIRAFIASRRSLDVPPYEELADYEEYAALYAIAWSEPTNRWLMANIPSTMIFDDHDVRDDWNTSHTWRLQMGELPWWHARIVGALASYWVYQHVGNLSPAELAEDEVWQHIAGERRTDPTYDAGPHLDAFASRADDVPDAYRWSFARDLGRTRLIVVDSRAARVLTPERRSMLNDTETAWLQAELRGDVDHLLVGTSLPFLLAPGLHHIEAWNEAVSDGAWGRRFSVLGERIRQGADLEHWAAFEQGFRTVAEAVTEVADGARGSAPAVTMFLSGDVHHSYLAEVVRSDGGRVLQAVCSPIRNPMPPKIQRGARVATHRLAGKAMRVLARAAGVPATPIDWSIGAGPWFDNCLATLETGQRSVRLRWETADTDSGDPTLRTVHETEVG